MLGGGGGGGGSIQIRMSFNIIANLQSQSGLGGGIPGKGGGRVGLPPLLP